MKNDTNTETVLAIWRSNVLWTFKVNFWIKYRYIKFLKLDVNITMNRILHINVFRLSYNVLVMI